MRTPPPTPPRGPTPPGRGPTPPGRGPTPPLRPPTPPRGPVTAKPAPKVTIPRPTPTRRGPAWLARCQRLILQPRQEWAAIAGEFTSAGPLYRRFLVPVAAVGPAASTLGTIISGGERSGCDHRPRHRHAAAAVRQAVVSGRRRPALPPARQGSGPPSPRHARGRRSCRRCA